MIKSAVKLEIKNDRIVKNDRIFPATCSSEKINGAQMGIQALKERVPGKINSPSVYDVCFL